MAKWEQINFQDRFSPRIEQLIFLHDHIIAILLVIIIITRYFIIFHILNSFTNSSQKDNHYLEILWTLLPGITLLIIAFPSLRILYLSEESNKIPIVVKTTGHQWYWSYEYLNFKNVYFDSFQTSTHERVFRTLNTDISTVMPCKTPIQLIISSADVLHAWTIPRLGLKADAVPGRSNILNTISLKHGTFYGQCSEICGTNHSFIPVKIKILPMHSFKSWLKSYYKFLGS